MAKKTEKVLIHHDFACEKESELSALISAFAAEHEATHQQILAMDARRSLGPGKVRVTFRVISKRTARR
ncbi:MAG: hypothetical protein JNM40_13095 [Myxococcales bacterium]|nr:hypothetical protein [Myxococcales bacterium]